MSPGTLIKPTRLTWEELEATPPQVKSGWADPVELGKAFVWLAAQPPTRSSGFRFDAAVIAKTIEAEGYAFPVTPEKVTLYPDDFRERQEWYARKTH
jgi:hypothetical protein